MISVWDKKGISDFAKKMSKFGVEIVSTGKTATLLSRNGIKVKKVAEVTGFPEFLSGRVKTLHPKIFGGILANKRHPLHMEEIKNLEVEPFDMVVINLYPFSQMLKEKLTFDQMIEYIDIGGPSMLRAGAKNFKNVACVSNFRQYNRIIAELEKNKGFLKEDTLKGLACEVFRLTKEYDNQIYTYLKGTEVKSLDLEIAGSLRYGENPHQKAKLFKLMDKKGFAFTQHQGKPLSYNNMLDLDTALNIVLDFNEPAAAVIKHVSPCGIAADKKLIKAFSRAFQCDEISAFGGIIGLNRKVDGKTAEEIIKTGFKECVIAPDYSKEALKVFSARKNLRVLAADFSSMPAYKDIRRSAFGYLMQDQDKSTYDKAKLQAVTKRKPTEREMRNLLFAWKAVKWVKSNAIVLAKDNATIGIGGGQPSRVGSFEIAVKKSIRSTLGAVAASDGFFPQADSIRLMKKYKIKAVIQPGGSIRDQEVIDACDKYKISMVFTGIRHFRH